MRVHPGPFLRRSSLLCCLGLLLASASIATAQAPSADPWGLFVTWAAEAHGEAGARAAGFLVEHRPARDASIDRRLLEDNLRCALEARQRFPWARALDEDVFHNEVLPYAVLDETRENWRPAMLERAAPIVAGCETATEAAQALNRALFDLVEVHYSTARERPNQSPAESMRQGMASCTGLSILLVDACRAVGVPARVAGVAQWNGKRGNHTWVEVYDRGRWWYTGADEFDAKGLDRGWFTADAARAVAGHPTKAVRATSFRATGSHFPMVWSRGDRSVPGVDVTARYDAPEAEAAADADAEAGAGGGGAAGPDGAVPVFVRAWRGEDRVAVRVRVLDADGREVAAVETRAGRADLNDMPRVELAVGVDYRFVTTLAGIERALPFTAEAGEGRTLDLRAAELALTRDGAEALVRRTFEELVEARRERAAEALERGSVRAAGTEMKFLERTFGEAPETGPSLWISLHGGGNTAAKNNDGQWRNQIRLYEPAEGIYVAPRAPTDTWNMWHRAHVDDLLDALVATYVAARGVDPDRVYLLGYSAGGDGVYQLAPRMADRFAAASMMAGHPNETKPAGLRNLPFRIFMGGKDAAYDRNAVAKAWGEALAALAEEDPGGYPHEVTIYPELGHWMKGRDKEALPWMAAHTRDPWPRKVVWRQDDVRHGRFYWLAVDPDVVSPGTEIRAEADAETNTVRVHTGGRVPAVTLRLRDGLLDLDRPVQVVLDDEAVFSGRVRRSEDAIRRSLAERLDPGTAAVALLRVGAGGAGGRR